MLNILINILINIIISIFAGTYAALSTFEFNEIVEGKKSILKLFILILIGLFSICIFYYLDTINIILKEEIFILLTILSSLITTIFQILHYNKKMN